MAFADKESKIDKARTCRKKVPKTAFNFALAIAESWDAALTFSICRSQKAYLRKYCNQHNLEILFLFRDDHSAKTFERPEFKKMLSFCKKNNSHIDFLLFVKWDRFSRNTKESYQMIHEFQKLNIEVRAIEQPLDLTVPESKLMLAINLASPRAENDRRSLNVSLECSVSASVLYQSITGSFRSSSNNITCDWGLNFSGKFNIP